MPKMIVSIDGVVIKEVQLTKEKTSLGRRPYNDIVIDNLAVSGEHAVVHMVATEAFLEDLNSTNGTYLNGKTVKKQLLQNGDIVEIGKYQIRFVSDAQSDGFEKTMMIKGGVTPSASGGRTGMAQLPVTNGDDLLHAVIKVLSGAAAGREVPLTKVVTTIGRPGVAVAAITRRQRGFFVHHVEGAGNPALNGSPIGADPVPLKNGDVIVLAGTQMQFVQT